MAARIQMKIKTYTAQILLILLLLSLSLHTRHLFNLNTKLKNNGKLEDDLGAVSDDLPEDIKRFNSLCPQNYQLDAGKIEMYEKVQQISKYRGTNTGVYRDSIVILTPVSNSAKDLHHFFSLICSLNYPHELISLVLGEDSSKDKTYELASMVAGKIRPYFKRVEVLHFKEEINSLPIFSRHDPDWQLVRRSHMAKARNQLLFRGLQDEDWVLWIDSDVRFIPPDIIQHLLSAEADIAVPSCVSNVRDGSVTVYDKNTWRETKESLDFLKFKPDNFLMLEGYNPTLRKYLPQLAEEGEVVKVDGVGGCTLMVRAQCHRKGLVFPPFIYKKHVETEGFAKMAADMGFIIKGLPLVHVFHL